MNVINLTNSVFIFHETVRVYGSTTTIHHYTNPGEGICSKTFPEEAAKLLELNSQHIDDVSNLLPEEME